MYKTFAAVILLLLPGLCMAQFSGTYTVNNAALESKTNYLSLQDVFQDLSSGVRNNGVLSNGPGLSGHVTINVIHSGVPYLEPELQLIGVQGSASKTLTINGNFASVIYSGVTNVRTEVMIVQIINSSHITLKNLHFENPTSARSGIIDQSIEIKSGSSHVTLSGVVIPYNIRVQHSTAFGHPGDHITIDDCVIGGSARFELPANDYFQKVHITNSDLFQSTEQVPGLLPVAKIFKGLMFEGSCHDLLIRGNRFTGDFGAFSLFTPKNPTDTTHAYTNAIIENNIMFPDKSLFLIDMVSMWNLNWYNASGKVVVRNNILMDDFGDLTSDDIEVINQAAVPVWSQFFSLGTSRNLDVVHNTMVWHSDLPDSAGFDMSPEVFLMPVRDGALTNWRIKNNLVSVQYPGSNGARVVYIGQDGQFSKDTGRLLNSSFDYNIFDIYRDLGPEGRADMAIEGYENAQISSSISDWTARSGMDANSASLIPEFADVKNFNLLPLNTEIHRWAPNVGVDVDIYGRPRGPFVEPGAFEFDNQDIPDDDTSTGIQDIGVSKIAVVGCDGGEFDMEVTVSNYGDSTVDAFYIKLKGKKGNTVEVHVKDLKNQSLPAGGSRSYRFDQAFEEQGNNGNVHFSAWTVWADDDVDANNRKELKVKGKCEKSNKRMSSASGTLSDVWVYPNPATSTIYVAADDFRSLRVLNPTGQVLGHSTIAEINVAHLSPGIYFLEVTTGFGEIKTRAIVKE